MSPTRPRVLRRLALLVILCTLALAGCGKKGAPQPAPGVPNTYPQPYPRE